MRNNYILIDYENVQPKDLGLLKDGSFKIKVFVGPHQSSVPVALASALQTFGENAEYIALEAGGKNALDFVIAYHIGVLSKEDPSACFHIISKDTGFDPLISHLKGKRVLASRSPCLAEIPCLKPIPVSTLDEQIKAAVAHLTRIKAAKPRTEKTLRSTLHTLFKKGLSEEQLSRVLDMLRSRGIITVEDKKVSYRLPTS